MLLGIPGSVWALFAAALLSILLAVVMVRNRTRRAALHILWMLAAVFIWIVAYACEIMAQSRDTMIVLANVQFIGIGATPILTLLAIRELIGRPPLRRIFVWLALLVPAVTVVLAFTDPLHGFFRGSPEVVRMAGMMLLKADYRWWHNMVFVPYQYIIYFGAVGAIVAAWTGTPAAFRGRYAALLVAVSLPMLGGLLYVLQVPPFQNLNPTPILLVVSLLLFLWVITRHKALDLVPIARERVVEVLSEAIIVVDREDRIVDFNPAAGELFPELGPAATGQSFAGLMGNYTELIVMSRGIDTANTGFQMGKPDSPRYCMAQAAPITGLDGDPMGIVISVTDITAQIGLARASAPVSVH